MAFEYFQYSIYSQAICLVLTIHKHFFNYMPYRRLPNTDASRLRALRKAFQIGKDLPPFKLAFSQGTFQKVQSFLPLFERLMQDHKRTVNQQIIKNKDFQLVQRKARMYISHFIQVMNMAIARGELPAITRTYYGFKEDDAKIPSLVAEQDVLKWGENILLGETKRAMKGLTPITNPTCAVVKVWYENFKEASTNQKTIQKNNTKSNNELNDLRRQADSIILQVWNEVENKFTDLPEEIKREKSAEYGISYVFRKNEISRLGVLENIPIAIA
jgi:hypothetical protein